MAHGSLGSGEAFPVVLQLLMDHEDGLTIQEIADFARERGLVEETEIAGVATPTRVRRAINSMVELGYAVEAGKGTSKAMRYKLNPGGIQESIEEGMLEILLQFKKRFGSKIPGLDAERVLEGMRKVMEQHDELLGMKLREAPPQP